MQLRGAPPSPPFDDDLGGSCRECRSAPAVGPCAACEQMICGDCGVLTRDPNGQAVICTSCAGLIADVRARWPARRPMSTRAIAVIAVIAFGVLALSLL
jgi:hypothetical protein